MWAQLSLNLMAVAFFISVWAHLQFWFAKRLRPVRIVAFGTAMGAGALVSMLLSFQLYEGVFFDLRSPLIAVAGFFGGPLGALTAAFIAGIYRTWMGGPGMWAGLTGIGLMAGIGTMGYLIFGRTPRTSHVVFLALAVGGGSMLSFMALPVATHEEAFSRLLLPICGLGVAATLIAGMILLQAKRMASERLLLRAAIAQAPDFQYVKNARSEFVAVNNQVARHNGFERPEEMVGKTDYDIVDTDRAQQLAAQEQRLLASGIPLLDLEEHLSVGGQDRWYLTSKVPVKGEHGETIGIAGVTRDITQKRKMELDLINSQNLLSFAMEEMADGVAMFDSAGFLIFSNERYRSSFPLTGEVRREGVHIRRILEDVVRSREQVNFGGQTPSGWIDAVETSLKSGGEEQVNLFDGRWLHLRTRVTDTGAAMVVVSDVTNLKRSEEELLDLTGQLRELAATDGLTGLANRRTLDQMLEDQLERTATSRSDLSLLMIDVDHFKKYNDTYGHQAGDECLRIIANCLTHALRRADDAVARYGGEEFVAILPATSEDDAFQVAERVRDGLENLAIPHKASPKGIVTVSIGLASYSRANTLRSVPQLISRADQALYAAKSAGRNRIMGWRPTDEGFGTSSMEIRSA